MSFLWNYKHKGFVDDLQKHELLTMQAVSCSHVQPASKYDIALSYTECYI